MQTKGLSACPKHDVPAMLISTSGNLLPRTSWLRASSSMRCRCSSGQCSGCQPFHLWLRTRHQQLLRQGLWARCLSVVASSAIIQGIALHQCRVSSTQGLTCRRQASSRVLHTLGLSWGGRHTS